MTITILYIALAVCAVAIGLLLAKQSKAGARVAKAEAAERQLSEERTALREECANLREANAALREEGAALRERLALMEAAREQNEVETDRRFKVLAASILDDNSRRLREQATASISDLLTPLHTRIEEFKKTVAEAYDKEARERFSLEKSLKDLMALNTTIGREAKELAEALRGNSKTQGDWGEMILEQLLEKSGLEKDKQFLVQVTTNTDGKALIDGDGHRIRPDVVVLYPDKRCVVVDSKVSLTAYVDLVNATTDAEREAAGRRHLDSIRNHLKELDFKAYQDKVGEKKLDFVVMFIPNEAAYISAMQLDPNIWQEAYDRRVLVASPTHLISILRLLEQLWKQDAVNRNVEKIAAESGAMLDKFNRFLGEMENIHKAIDKARDAYQSAYSHLASGKGNLMRRADNILRLGAKVKSTSIPIQSALDTADEDEGE